MSLKWLKTSSYKSVISREAAQEATDVQIVIVMVRSDQEVTRTARAISKVVKTLNVKARSAGKYNW